VAYVAQIQHRESQMLPTNGQCPLHSLAAVIPRCICIKLYHWANNRGRHADRFHNSMIHNKDVHIPLPLIMFTCTDFCHALLEWQKNKRIHPKAPKSKLKADRPDYLNYFNYNNDGGTNTFSCGAMGCKLLTSPGIADTYTFLRNTWNTLPESYQQRVYTNPLATVQCQIQQVENPTPTVVISVEAAHVYNAILLHYFTSKVALEQPEIGSIHPNIPIENNCTDN